MNVLKIWRKVLTSVNHCGIISKLSARDTKTAKSKTKKLKKVLKKS